ncbi:hypothetical protein MN608_03363 [Microdochium nivale]|nr:hypothetical protein MN608_03363 [Microdochium nivale]
MEKAERTLMPYRKWLSKQKRKERSNDQKAALEQMKQQKKEKDSLAKQKKRKRTQKHYIEDDEFKPEEATASRPQKKAKVAKEITTKPKLSILSIPSKFAKPVNLVTPTAPAKPMGAARSDLQKLMPTQHTKDTKNTKIANSEQSSPSRKRQHPIEVDEATDVKRPQKKQANKASLTATVEKRGDQKNKSKSKSYPAKERIIQRHQFKDDSSVTDAESDIESYQQTAQAETFAPVQSRPAYTQGFDPITGQQLITMHISPEIAAAMAKLPPGARFRASQSGLPEIITAPNQAGQQPEVKNAMQPAVPFQPVVPLFMPGSGSMNALTQGHNTWQLAWLQHQMFMVSIMASMGQQNPAMGQNNNASDLFRAATAPGSQLPTPTSPAFPSPAETMLNNVPGQTGTAFPASRETIEIIDGPVGEPSSA